MNNETAIALMNNYVRFHYVPKTSRKIDLEFEAESDNPWVNFHCKEKPDLSFRIHNLDLKEEDSLYWHFAAFMGKKAYFHGHQPFPYMGRKMRGILESEKDHKRLGVVFGKNGIEHLASDKELFDPIITFGMAYMHAKMPHHIRDLSRILK